MCDLGVAKLQDQLATIKTSKGSGTGTVPYIATDMLMDAKRSWQADMYSFGCLLIELSTGKQVCRELDAVQITAEVYSCKQSTHKLDSMNWMTWKFQMKHLSLRREHRPLSLPFWCCQSVLLVKDQHMCGRLLGTILNKTLL